MAIFRYFFGLLVLVYSTNFVQCAEFVPVYMWGTNKLSEHAPALHKISQDSFKDTLLEYLKKDPFVVVFTERTLSPEDFAQRDQNGKSAFINLQELKNEGNYVSYRGYVQNPVGAVKQLNKPVTEISIASILNSDDVPKGNVWIINLDDAREDETRLHMLSRHDRDIVSIYKNIQKQHDNVLVLYTANHTAWVAPDDVTHGKARLLLQTEDDKKPDSVIVFTDINNGSLLTLTDFGKFGETNITEKFQLSSTREGENISAILTDGAITIKFHVVKDPHNYWYLNVEVNGKPAPGKETKNFYAPVGFSYHCGQFNVSVGEKTSASFLYLPGFQFQAFFPPSMNTSRFGDAYDCVGFTSVPIWSGLFVTAILLLIITFGLTMMMDIKTMDRFDDPKGKTITISASE